MAQPFPARIRLNFRSSQTIAGDTAELGASIVYPVPQGCPDSIPITGPSRLTPVISPADSFCAGGGLDFNRCSYYDCRRPMLKPFSGRNYYIRGRQTRSAEPGVSQTVGGAGQVQTVAPTGGAVSGRGRKSRRLDLGIGAAGSSGACSGSGAFGRADPYYARGTVHKTRCFHAEA